MGLSLGRFVGQPVYLTNPDGTVVKVEVRQVKGKTVRLSFTAPRGVEIVRCELLSDSQRAEMDAKAGS